MTVKASPFSFTIVILVPYFYMEEAVMSKYPEELKRQVVEDYIRGDRPTAEILGIYNIPKSNLFRWLKKYGPPKEVDPLDEFNPRNFYLRGVKIERLETIISILKRVRCTVDAPLSDRLKELERLYGEYHIHTLCDALEVSRGTFYNHIKRNKRENTIYAQRREMLKKRILEIDEDAGHVYGAAKITALLKENGFPVCVETVRDLMRELGLQNVRYGAKRQYEKEEFLHSKNYLNQDFSADRPNAVWVGDVTYFRLKGKEYFICVIMDLFSRKVVAHKIGLRDNTHLTKATFLIATQNRQPAPGLIFHSDQGTSYRSYTYQKCLAGYQVIQSFSRPHTPQDNAPMESFFASLKKEKLYRIQYRSPREFYDSVDTYVNWYNLSRPHQNLRYKTPDAIEEEYYLKSLNAELQK